MRTSSPDLTVLRYGIISCLAALSILASAAFAQDGGTSDQAYVVIESVDPPRGDLADTYHELAKKNRAQSRVEYVSKLDWELAAKPDAPIKPRRTRSFDPDNLNGFGVLLAIIILGGALVLWLKFGGSGALLAREPSERKQQTTAPDSWNITAQDISGSTQDFLARLAAMPDRSAALVLLLRHCLLAAAQATDTRFARSDTERLAFRRLPNKWSKIKGLEVILHRTELAHYGARPVTEDVFSSALNAGRVILEAGKQRRGKHG